MDLTALVEPDRVHKTVYTDQQIFDAEMERIWERIWVYCGHESQVPERGDYYAVTIGRQPMIMVRQKDGSVQVLYNRCPHRGVQVVVCEDDHGISVIRANGVAVDMKHPDLLAVKDRRPLGIAQHIDVVADQMLALARRRT